MSWCRRVRRNTQGRTKVEVVLKIKERQGRKDIGRGGAEERRGTREEGQRWRW